MAFGIGEAITAGIKVLDKFIPDPAEKARAEAELRSSLMQWDKNQTDVNAVEAANSSVFVSGWRPAIGWTCAAALAYQYVVTPLAIWIAAMMGYTLPIAPSLDGMLFELLLGMLGLGGLRTFEKVKGVAR